MRNKRILIVTLALCCGIGIIIPYYFVQREIPFQFECAIEVKGNTASPLSFYYAPSEDRFRFWTVEYRVRHNLQPIIEYDNLEQFDFDKYDYLLYYGRKLKRLYHSPWLTYSEDDCHYAPEIPLMNDIEDASMDTLYIYSIKKKGKKYRPPCP